MSRSTRGQDGHGTASGPGHAAGPRLASERRDPARLSPEQTERYQAHLALPEVGVGGQRKLRQAHVLLIGLGGLGCPAGLYLAAAGVGRLGLVDDDIVDRTNLQRQVLYGPGDVGRSKAEVAAERLSRINPDVEVVAVAERIRAGNAARLVDGWHLVVDGSDNFATRYVVNDATVLAHIPLVTGSIYRYEGQVMVIDPPAGPCYRCLFPVPPPEQAACQDAGVLASLPGVVGSVQATEALKLLLGIGKPLCRRLLLIDTIDASFRSVRVEPDPACPLCGAQPTIRSPTAVTTGAGC